MGVMAVMKPKEGDVRVIWDTQRPAEVDAARAQFNQLRGQGYLAYSVAEGGGRGTQLTEFDPLAEKIILAPALQGG